MKTNERIDQNFTPDNSDPSPRKILSHEEIAYKLAIEVSKMSAAHKEVEKLISCLSIIDPESVKVRHLHHCAEELYFVLEDLSPEARWYYYEIQSIPTCSKNSED